MPSFCFYCFSLNIHIVFTKFQSHWHGFSSVIENDDIFIYSLSDILIYVYSRQHFIYLFRYAFISDFTFEVLLISYFRWYFTILMQQFIMLILCFSRKLLFVYAAFKRQGWYICFTPIFHFIIEVGGLGIAHALWAVMLAAGHIFISRLMVYCISVSLRFLAFYIFILAYGYISLVRLLIMHTASFKFIFIYVSTYFFLSLRWYSIYICALMAW